MESAHKAISRTQEEQLMTISYHEFQENSKQKAREVVRNALENNEGNVSKMSRMLGIARKTVCRARNGTLADYS
jgi:transcriptional regulator of acetoin/glycerol metabolism